MMGAAKVNRSPIFREFMKYLSKGRTYAKRCPDLKKLLNSKEYKENEKLKVVQCELELMEHRINRSDYHALQFLVFKFSRNHGKKNAVEDEEEAASEDDEQDQNQQMRNATPIIQEVFGKSEDAGLLRQPTNTTQYNATMNKAFTNTLQDKKGTLREDAAEAVRKENPTSQKKVGFADDVRALHEAVGGRAGAEGGLAAVDADQEADEPEEAANGDHVRRRDRGGEQEGGQVHPQGGEEA